MWNTRFELPHPDAVYRDDIEDAGFTCERKAKEKDEDK
jgi:hypothetical protein